MTGSTCFGVMASIILKTLLGQSNKINTKNDIRKLTAQ